MLASIVNKGIVSDSHTVDNLTSAVKGCAVGCTSNLLSTTVNGGDVGYPATIDSLITTGYRGDISDASVIDTLVPTRNSGVMGGT
ncbi:Uncharacterised protein [Yersinia frederiksenii]|nr:Uncharacterised protein [Yersinia frederiksenii]